MLITESSEPLEMRRAAVQAIDTHLAARGLSNLIKGYPRLPVGQEDTEPPRKKRRKSKHGDAPKRPAFPGASLPAEKKVKRVVELCVICGDPLHLAKSCPLVKGGPESIRQAISRLAHDPEKTSTVNILRSLLSNLAASQPEAASGSALGTGPEA